MTSFSYVLGQAVFLEQDGLVVIEAESTEDDFGNWVADTSITNYTGSRYLRYLGDNHFNDPGNDQLNYKIQIATPGRYRFQWRSRITIGEDNTEHNDSWLRFPDADRFFAMKDGVVLYPKGTGMTPNPVGSSKDGWFKIYQNVVGNWTWNANTNDHDPHPIFVEFDEPGEYTMQISGRSNGHAVDRIALYHSTVTTSFATNTNRSESPRIIATGVTEITWSPVLAYPNPTADIIRITLPATAGKLKTLSLYSALRRVVFQDVLLKEDGPELRVSLANLPAGYYQLLITSESGGYRTQVQKQ